jgi:DNA-binding transcriptional regulator YiaG
MIQNNKEKNMYHYKECGLNNIYLINGVETVEMDGEEYTGIHNANSLNNAIAAHICEQKAWISPEQLKFLRIELDLSQSSLGKLLYCNRQTIARWEKGNIKIPYIYDVVFRSLFLKTIGIERPIFMSIQALVDAETMDVQSKICFKENGGKWEIVDN